MAKPTKAQKRKRIVQRVIFVVAVVLVALLAGTLIGDALRLGEAPSR